MQTTYKALYKKLKLNILSMNIVCLPIQPKLPTKLFRTVCIST